MTVVASARDAAGRPSHDDGWFGWGRGVDVVLEKHGFLPSDPVDSEVVLTSGLLAQPGVFLLTRQPDAFWTPDAVRAVADARAGLFIEGPLSPALADEFGIERVGPLTGWEGAVMPDTKEFIAESQAYGAAPGGRVGLAVAGRAERWGALGRCTRLASYVSGERTPAVAQAGSHIVSAFGLLALLAERHAPHPEEGAHPTLGLEVMLLAIIDHLHRAVDVPRVRVTGWAGGARMGAALLHEVRGPLAARDVAVVANHDDAAGLSPTWSWPASLADDAAALAAAGDGGAALALTAEGPAPDAGLRTLADAAGQSPWGVTPARTSGAEPFGTATDVVWADEHGLTYIEADNAAHMHPHRVSNIAQDGTSAPADVLCVPRTQTITDDEATMAASIARTRAAGGLLVVRAPPDPDDDTSPRRVGDLLAAADRRTLGELAQWWSRSRALRVLSVDGRRVRFRALEPVGDVTLEMRDRDGCAAVRVDVVVGEQIVEFPSPGAPDLTPDRFAEDLEDVCAAQGVPADQRWVAAARAEDARAAERLAAVESLLPRGSCHVLVHGAHAGGLALALAVARPDVDVTAVTDERFAAVAGACAAYKRGLDKRVQFLAAAQLDRAGPARLVLAVPSSVDALERLLACVAPGGSFVAFDATAPGKRALGGMRVTGEVQDGTGYVLTRSPHDTADLVIAPQIPRDLSGWKPIERAYGTTIRGHLDARRLGSPATRDATLRTNTVNVPSRGETLFAYLRHFAGIETLEGLRLVEIGCGFGALAAYLTWRGSTADTFAVDLEEDTVTVARAAAEAAGLMSLRFATADARTLEPISDGTADIVVANNSLLYLTSKRALDEALSSIARVLAPDGVVVIYQANRLRVREPFTGAPLIHLLPPRAGRIAGRIAGLPHNHGRVRLVSPREFRRRLRAAGFVDVVTAPPGTPNRRARDVSEFFGAVARAPRAASSRGM